MNIVNRIFWIGFLFTILLFGCVTKKKKGQTSKAGKFYHNTTSYYNGYWNATELLRLNMINMKSANVEDYNTILEVEDFVNLPNPKMVDADMNKAIEKVTVVYNIHEPGDLSLIHIYIRNPKGVRSVVRIKVLFKTLVKYSLCVISQILLIILFYFFDEYFI